MSHTDVLFRDLHADDLPEVTEVESLCLNCHEDGITKLLLTRIPFFRDVIISSFACEHCGFHNTSLDSAARCQDKGVKFTLKVVTNDDMNRRVVLNKASTLTIPELDSSFYISEGALTTIEGALTKIIDNINTLQDIRRNESPELAAQLDQFIVKLRSLMDLKKEFIFELADPSGNSAIENLMAPKADPQMTVEYYKRTPAENEALCIDESESEDRHVTKTYVDEAEEEFKAKGEAALIESICPECYAPIQCVSTMLDIPHFKETIIMASKCDHCDHRENYIIGGSGIADKGERITLHLNESIDLSRDFLKSDNAGIVIPEIELEVTNGTLGGRFTTVEGILITIAESLERDNPFAQGDSAQENNKIQDIIYKLRQIANGEMFGVTIIVIDPTANSYIQDVYTPEVDPRLTTEFYDRTEEENEEMGLNDMVTENYQ